MKIIQFIFVALFLVGSQARAGIITVTGTLAVAGSNLAPLLATYTNTNGSNSAKSIADVEAGHVGAAFTAINGYPGAGNADIMVALSFTDMTADDFLLLGISLHGTFGSAIGAGSGEGSLLVDDGTNVTNVADISCSAFVAQAHGTPCYPAASLQVLMPLDGVDSVTLSWELQLGGAVLPSFADFYNSLDASIIVPAGTTIVNNPGGTLFQTQGASASIPEPNSIFLIGSGLIMVAISYTKLSCAKPSRHS